MWLIAYYVSAMILKLDSCRDWRSFGQPSTLLLKDDSVGIPSIIYMPPQQTIFSCIATQNLNRIPQHFLNALLPHSDCGWFRPKGEATMLVFGAPALTKRSEAQLCFLTSGF
jgi:hypothetical protein